MVGASLLTLIDDIASVLDDIAILTKVTAKKTAGVLGDDLALNTALVSGVASQRELPVIWAVTKGSFINKLILVPIALLISAFLPALIFPLLALGGIYLCFEGIEKIWHSLTHKKKQPDKKNLNIKANQNWQEYEQKKIKAAIRTDFVLSAEIIVIALGTVKQAQMSVQIGALSLIAILMTIGVYGLVATIIKIDDLGIWLMQKSSTFLDVLGRGLLRFAPWLMHSLSYIGTLAMFLVGGGIIIHGLPPSKVAYFQKLLTTNWMPNWFTQSLLNIICGLIVGVFAVLIFNGITKVYYKFK